MKGLRKEHNTARKLEYICYQGAIPCNLLFPRNNIPVQNSQETHLESGIFYQALRPRDQLFISAGIKINLVKHIWSIRVRCFIQSFALGCHSFFWKSLAFNTTRKLECIYSSQQPFLTMVPVIIYSTKYKWNTKHFKILHLGMVAIVLWRNREE